MASVILIGNHHCSRINPTVPLQQRPGWHFTHPIFTCITIGTVIVALNTKNSNAHMHTRVHTHDKRGKHACVLLLSAAQSSRRVVLWLSHSCVSFRIDRSGALGDVAAQDPLPNISQSRNAFFLTENITNTQNAVVLVLEICWQTFSTEPFVTRAD